MIRVEWLIARRYLWGGRWEGFLHVMTGFSFLGISLGVATLIIVMSVMNGFRQELTQRTLQFNSHISVVPRGHFSMQEAEAFLKKARVHPEIHHIYPVVEGQAMLVAGGHSLGVMVRGLQAEDLERKSIVSKTLLAGSLSRFLESEDGILIGIRLAEKLNLQMGDVITLIAAQGDITPFGMIPRLQTFTIQGIFNSGLFHLDKTMAFLPFREAQVFFKSEGQVSFLEAYLQHPDRAMSLLPLFRQWGKPVAYHLIPWEKAHAGLFEALQIERNVMFLILTLIIVIAAFNIISGLFMLVKDKTSDIGILRTMGVSQRSILRIFLMVGSSIGVAGALVGTTLGVLFCHYIESIRQFFQSLTGRTLFDAEFYFLSKLPAILQYEEVILIVLITLGLTFLSTFYPAWRAARLNPVEALRYG